MTAPQAAGAPVSNRFWLVLTALMSAELTCALESNMINVALAHLYGLYGDPVHVTWLITAFTLTSAASAAVCSRLGDIFGRRRVMTIMLLIAMTGSLISATAHDLNVIILGRALQGASMAVLPLAFGILRETATKAQLNVGVGILGGTYSFGVGFGTITGGLIVDHAHWQNIFLVSAALAGISLLLVRSVIPKSAGRRPDGPLDLVGGALFVVPIASLLLGLTNGKSQGWDSPYSWGLLAAGAAGLVVWVRHELRQPTPLIDVRLLRTPQIAIVNAVIFFTSMGPLIYPFVLLPLLQQPVWTGIGLGISATLAGVFKLPTNLSSGAAGIAAGFVARRFTMRPIIILATVLNLIAWLLLLIEHESIWFLMIAIVLMIAPAATVIFSCAPTLIIEVSPEDRTSEATGLTQVIRAIAMSIGSQMIAFTLATSSIIGPTGAKYPDERAYLVTFLAIAACAMASCIAALFIPRPSADAAEVGAVPVKS